MACAQNGLEVALKSLNVAVPPPKFVSHFNKDSIRGVELISLIDIFNSNIEIVQKRRRNYESLSYVYLQHDTSSPLLAGGVAVDTPWVVKVSHLQVYYLFNLCNSCHIVINVYL